MHAIPPIFFISATAVMVTVVAFIFVHRITKKIDLEQHQSFLDAILSIVGTLVSILLGMLVAAALDHYRSMEQVVDTEATSVTQIVRLTCGLPAETQKRVRRLCIDYCHEVIEIEWPSLAEGRSSPDVMLTYGRLVSEIVTFQPSTNGETNIHSSLLTAMQQIGDCRRQRLLVTHSSWIKQLMPLLLMCSAIVLTLALLYVRRGAILHGVLICFVVVALGGNLWMVYILSNPFSGAWMIQPTGFVLNLRLIEEVKADPRFRDILQKHAR